MSHIGAIATQDQSILTIQDKLSRLSKELYISSDQIHVIRRSDPENGAVFDNPVDIGRDGTSRASLTNELECMNTMAQEMARNMELQRRMATTQSKQLELKACKETEAIANQNKEHLGKIQQFLDSNMDVNLMDIRRNQDLLLSQLEDYHMLLDEKTTEKQVDSRIERRYDDLVSHLQLAMQSVKADEANFKACIQRIEQANSQLLTNKAERSELNELYLSEHEEHLNVYCFTLGGRSWECSWQIRQKHRKSLAQRYVLCCGVPFSAMRSSRCSKANQRNR